MGNPYRVTTSGQLNPNEDVDWGQSDKSTNLFSESPQTFQAQSLPRLRLWAVLLESEDEVKNHQAEGSTSPKA